MQPLWSNNILVGSRTELEMKALPRVFLRQRVNQPEYLQPAETCSIVREDDLSDLNIKQILRKKIFTKYKFNSRIKLLYSKGHVCVILSGPLRNDGSVRFTTVPLKPLFCSAIRNVFLNKQNNFSVTSFNLLCLSKQIEFHVFISNSLLQHLTFWLNQLYFNNTHIENSEIVEICLFFIINILNKLLYLYLYSRIKVWINNMII